MSLLFLILEIISVAASGWDGKVALIYSVRLFKHMSIASDFKHKNN